MAAQCVSEKDASNPTRTGRCARKGRAMDSPGGTQCLPTTGTENHTELETEVQRIEKLVLPQEQSCWTEKMLEEFLLPRRRRLRPRSREKEERSGCDAFKCLLLKLLKKHSQSY